jgi:hypothetical protein
MRRLDAFVRPSEPDVVQKKTSVGACVSVTGIVVMLLLVASEFAYYRHTNVEHHLRVDTTGSESERVSMDFHITLPHLPCSRVSFELYDVRGLPQDAGTYTVHTTKLSVTEDGSVVHPALSNADVVDGGVGCSVGSTITVPQVAGEVRVAAVRPPPPFDTVANSMSFNATHRVERLQFGPPVPSISNPLTGSEKVVTRGVSSFDYFIQLVPTQYTTLDGTLLQTLQYSVTEFEHENAPRAAVSFKYDFAPLVVVQREGHRSAAQFVTSLCAIVSGVFACSGFVNSAVHAGLKTRKTRQ